MRSTCFQLVKHLSKNHDTALLSMIESEDEKKFIPEMKKWCPKVETVLHTVPRSPLLRIVNTLFKKIPFCVEQFYSPAFDAKLKEMLRDGQYDVVHMLSVNITGYLDTFGDTPGLFFPHDSVSMQFRRNAQKEPRLLRKLYLYAQSVKMKCYEKEVIHKAAKTVVVSDVDRKWISEFLPDNTISVIPGGVDPDMFKPMDTESKIPTVIFRGVMEFIPNIDAALYFHREVMPLVLKEIPDLQFYIIGKNPPEEVQRIHDGKHIFVTGLVDDLRPYMAQAAVHVCPMRSGSGMKNKVLEAWSMEKPVVATSLACDGIDLTPGKHLLTADTPAEFAKCVVELFKNPALRKQLGQAGKALAVEKYTWAYVATLFEKVYRDMIANRKTNQRSGPLNVPNIIRQPAKV